MLLNFFMYLIGLVLIYLIIIIFSPVFPKPRQPIESNNEFKAADSLPNRIDISCKVEEDTIRGWLYLPDDISGKVPCVILNNGFGGTKDMILGNYAKEFIKEGSLMIMDGSILDMMEVYEDLERYIMDSEYEVCSFGYDPYNAKEFVQRWETEHGPFGVEKVRQGSRTESVPLGELKKLAEDRKLIFDQSMMTFAMGNAITLEDTNGNRKLWKKRRGEKIDSVAALMDSYVAYKANKMAFE